MLRRLYSEQPESFAFTEANQRWAEAQITKYPEGRQASAVIPLLWRAQEQEGWLSRPAMEHVAAMLDMAYIRVLEVATFYFMFQLQPVGSVAHVQVCGTTSCMICGAEDLIAVCKEKIAPRAHALSEDGKLSWEEVECLGACANAPMAQIGKDYYEDLTAKRFGEILDELRAGKVPQPGPQNGRFASEPKSGLTSLGEGERTEAHNGSVALALQIGDTVKRIDGTEVPLITPWREAGVADADPVAAARDDLLQPDGPDGNQGGRVAGDNAVDRDRGDSSDKFSEVEGEAEGVEAKGWPKESGEGSGEVVSSADAPSAAGGSEAPDSASGAEPDEAAATPTEADRPQGLDGPREGGADDLKKIKGVGPKLEQLLHRLGFFHFDQIANWSEREIAWVDDNLEGFKGRVTRDDWVGQAKTLAEGGDTNFSKRVDKGDVY